MFIQVMYKRPEGWVYTSACSDLMLPFIFMMDNNKDDASNLMTMVMLSSAMGGMNNAQGYNTNFNMLLPMALSNCKAGDKDCVEKRNKMIVLLMAMQSSAPGSPLNSQQLLPLLLMKDNANNEQLIVFMTMMGQQPDCLPRRQEVVITQPLPEPVVETIFREFKVDAETGERTLVRTSNRPFDRAGQ